MQVKMLKDYAAGAVVLLAGFVHNVEEDFAGLLIRQNFAEANPAPGTGSPAPQTAEQLAAIEKARLEQLGSDEAAKLAKEAADKLAQENANLETLTQAKKRTAEEWMAKRTDPLVPTLEEVMAAGYGLEVAQGIVARETENAAIARKQPAGENVPTGQGQDAQTGQGQDAPAGQGSSSPAQS